MGRVFWGGDDVPAALVNISMHECGDDSCSSSRFTAAAVRLGLSLLLSRHFHLYFLFIYYIFFPPPNSQVYKGIFTAPCLCSLKCLSWRFDAAEKL